MSKASKHDDLLSISVVGIGASAGGLNAVREFLSPLPAETGMAFVVVQHLDPNHESHLAELLGRSTNLRVQEATDGLPVAAEHVYVIPPGKEMTIEAGRLRLSPRDTAGVGMAIDRFFFSLAKDIGTHAVGIVLSGAGSDGALGLKEIRAAGGVTFAQDERSADCPAMPRNAVLAGGVDFILPPSSMARELLALAVRREESWESDSSAPPGSEDEQKEILSRLRVSSGVDFTHYKRATLWRRVRRRMGLSKVESLGEYVKLLEQRPEETELLFQDILISVTSFFRDPDTFDALEKEVFPRIVQGKTLEDPVRIWVPGCSTGEEAYSLAIRLHEFLGERGTSVGIQIFGTDVNDVVIDRAREGIYTEGIAAQMPEETLRRYFGRHERGYQVCKPLRDMCIFARQNIAADPPLSRMDLISCRNLLIYFDHALQKRVIPILSYALRPTSGYLVLGRSEAVDEYSDLFQVVDKKNKIFLRRAAVSRVPPELGARGKLTAKTVGGKKSPAESRIFTEVDLHREADRIVLASYSPPGLVINEHLEILQFRGRVSTYLNPGTGRASLNLNKMVRQDLLHELRGALDQAIKGEVASVRRDNVRFSHDGVVQYVNIRVIPLKVPEAKDRFFLVVFEEARELQVLPALKSPASEEQSSQMLRQEVARLEEELDSTRQYLQTIIDEREVGNEELQSANEEILSSNEELQTINQELETAKEELESANEELTTLNDELQDRLEEVKRAHDYTKAIVETVREPLIVLNAVLEVQSANRSFYEIFHLPASEVEGRAFYALGSGQWNVPALLRALQQTLTSDDALHDFEIELSFPHLGRRVMQISARRVHETSGASRFLLVAIDDITDRKRIEATRARLATIVDQSHEAIYSFDRDGLVLSWNRSAERIFGYTASQIVGQSYAKLFPRDRVDEHKEIFEAILAGRQITNFETIRVRRDGWKVDVMVTVSPIRDEASQIVGGSAIVRDMSERKRSQEELKRSNERFRLLVSGVKDYAIFMLDAQGRIQSWNEGAERIKGYTEDEVLGKPLSMFYTPEDRASGKAEKELQITRRDGRYEEEGIRVRKDGSRFFADCALTALYDEKGEVYGFAKVTRDITERKRVENEVRELNALLERRVAERTKSLETTLAELERSNAELEQFAYVSSHDLKEPLRMVTSYTRLLEKKYADKLDAEGREFINFACEGAKRMYQLIEDLMNYSQVDRARDKFALVDCQEVFEIAVANLRVAIEETGAKVSHGPLPKIRADKQQLVQVFQNLIANAIKFRNPQSSPLVEISARKNDDHWQFSFRDNGIGIEPEYRDRIFVIFQRLHSRESYPGTGIGLAICKKIVERHGGKIWVESKPGHGSIFHFTVPFELKERAEPKDAMAEA